MNDFASSRLSKWVAIYVTCLICFLLFPRTGVSQEITYVSVDSLRLQVEADVFPENIEAGLALIKHYTLSHADSALYWYNRLQPVVNSIADNSWDEPLYQAAYKLGSSGHLTRDQRYSLLSQVAEFAESTEKFQLLLYTHRQLSNLFFRASQLDKALEYQLLAMQDSRRPGVPAYTRVFPYISLAHIYGQRPTGKLYADSAMALIRDMEDIPLQAEHWMHTHIGTYFQRIGHKERALRHFETAYAIVDENESLSFDPYLLLVFGKVYLGANDFDKAEEYLRRALEITDEDVQAYEDTKVDIAEYFITLGRKTGEVEQVEKYAYQILETAHGVGYLKPSLIAHRTLHDVYADRGQFEKSEEHLTRYFAIQDSLDVLNKANAEYLQTRALESTVNRNRMEVVQAKLQAQSSRMIVVSVMLLLVLVLLVFFILSRRTQKKHNATLSIKNKEIRASNRALVKMNEQLKEAKKKVEESDQLKTSILQNMSHELRTPLTAILGYAEMIKDDLDDLDEVAEGIQKGGQRLMDTLTSVLDLAQLEGGKTKLKPALFDLSKSLEEKVAEFEPLAKEKGLSLNYSVKNAQGLTVQADRQAVDRIIINLMQNAIQFTKAGGVGVALKRSGQDIILKIEDSGIGMNSSFLPHAFDSFRQESTGHGRSYEGIGLGLPIVKHLVELMEGQINVFSEKGRGSTFTLTLPIAVS